MTTGRNSRKKGRSAMKTSKVTAFIDYLTFTFTPEPLLQLKDLARTGAAVKRPDGMTAPDPAIHRAFAESLNAPKYDAPGSAAETTYKPNLLDGLQYESAGLPYHEALEGLCDHFGYDLIDTLCRGELDRFITRVNHGLTCDYGHAEWTIKENPTGRFHYDKSATLLANGVQAGLVCWGGSNLGCMISLTGAGCQSVNMADLHKALKNLPGVRITRVDLAHDDYAGKRDIEWAKEQAENKGFMLSNRPPAYTYIESGHLYSLDAGLRKKLNKSLGYKADKGRSFYVGSRTSGKLYRCYEKGKQLGKTDSPWVRHEMELRNIDREIPLDVLLNPTTYLAGAYPCMAFLDTEQTRIETVKRSCKVTYENAVAHAAKQAGRLINAMRLMGVSPEQIVNRLTGHLDDLSLPPRLMMPPVAPETPLTVTTSNG